MTDATSLVSAAADVVEELVPELTGRSAFQARVAVQALRIVERELAHGSPGLTDQERTELAERIRSGQVDDTIRASLVRDVLARIAVDSPAYPSVAEAEARWAQ